MKRRNLVCDTEMTGKFALLKTVDKSVSRYQVVGEILGIIPKVKKRIEIDVKNYIPIMISIDGGVVFLPIGMKDAPIIGITGKRGCGKSNAATEMIDQILLKTKKDNVFIINDINAEDYSHRFPQDDLETHQVYKHYGLNIEPRGWGKELVTVAPGYTGQVPDKFVDKIFFMDLEEIRSTNVWKCILDFSGSGSKVAELIFDSICLTLQECKDLDEIESKIMKKQRIPKRIRDAIILRMETYMRSPRPNHPIIRPPDMKKDTLKHMFRLFKNHRVVAVNTKYCDSYVDKYKHFYMAGMIDYAFNLQLEGVHHPEKNKTFASRMWVVINEMESQCSTQNQTHGLAKLLKEVYNRGRTRRMGGIWTGLNYAKVSKFIRTQTDIMICFTIRGKDNRVQLRDDFGLTEKTHKNMSYLGKYEAMIISKEIPMVISYPNGRKIETTEPIRGYFLPSISMHLGAGEIIEDGKKIKSEVS